MSFSPCHDTASTSGITACRPKQHMSGNTLLAPSRDLSSPHAFSWSKKATSWPTGTFLFPTSAAGGIGAPLRSASCVCRRTTSGSTNLPDVGVTGGIGAPVAPSESPSPKRSVERERTRRGVIGEGAEIAWDAIGTYIDCGRIRRPDFPFGEGEGEVLSAGGASCLPAVLPIVSSPAPADMSSESSPSSSGDDIDAGELESSAMPKSRDFERECERARGPSSCGLRSRCRDAFMMGSPSATV